MRNLKRLLACVLSMVLALGLIPSAAYAASDLVVHDPNTFNDIKGHWAEQAMGLALQNGLIGGTDLNKADPDGPITRAQMATLMVRAFEATKVSSGMSYSDVSVTQWFYDSIARAIPCSGFQ